MFKSVIIYRITPETPVPSASELESALAAKPFVECAPTQRESDGWVPPRGQEHGAVVEVIDGQFILALSVQQRKLPAYVVKEELEERLDNIEEETGRRPRGKAKKALKEEIELDLLPRAFTKTATTLAWVDAKAGLLYVGAGSQKVADHITTALVQALDGKIGLAMLSTNTSPSTAMATWLRSREAPANFSVDRECVLKQPDETKASVKYQHHALDIDEVTAHIEEGKTPTQLAMTWDGRVSFVLTDMTHVKRISLLGIKDEKAEGDEDKDANFDASVALVTGALRKMVPHLIEALDGETEPA